MVRRVIPSAALTVTLLVCVPAADAAPQSVTITGSQGRDELSVTTGPGAREGEIDVVIRPAASAALSPSGSCVPAADPVTGRPRETRCRVGAAFDLIVDLRGADDVLEVNFASDSGVDLLNVVGGLGNDAIAVRAPASQTVRGAEGDDTLSTAGLGNRSVTLDGGAGRDLVDYFGGGEAPSGSVRGGVTASLTTGTARWLYGRHPAAGDFARQDTLVGIERLSGTEFGDSLTGSAGTDELIGEAGPDNLDGLDGNDTLAGGDGEDAIVGGNGTDALDGGKHVDEFRTGLGGDTVNSRDAFVERVSCTTARETVINDLVDALDNAANCASVSTAAAKHRFDTVLASRRLRVGARRRVRVRVSCPRSKPDNCSGTLRLRSARTRRSVAAGRYRLRPGRATVLRPRLSAAEAAGVRARGAILDAREVDGDGRDRRVTRRVAVR